MSVLGLEFKKTINIKKSIDNYLEMMKDNPIFNGPKGSYDSLR